MGLRERQKGPLSIAKTNRLLALVLLALVVGGAIVVANLQYNLSGCFGCAPSPQPPVFQVLASGIVGQSAFFQIINDGQVDIASIEANQSGSRVPVSCLGCSFPLVRGGRALLMVAIDFEGNRTLEITTKAVQTSTGSASMTSFVTAGATNLALFPFGSVGTSSGPSQLFIAFRNINNGTPVASLQVVVGQFPNDTFTASFALADGLPTGKVFAGVTSSDPCPATTSLCRGQIGLKLTHGYYFTAKVIAFDSDGDVLLVQYADFTTGPAD